MIKNDLLLPPCFVRKQTGTLARLLPDIVPTESFFIPVGFFYISMNWVFPKLKQLLKVLGQMKMMKVHWLIFVVA